MQRFAFTIRKASVAEAEYVFNVIDEYYAEIGVIVRETRAELEQYLSMNQSGIWLAWSDAEKGRGTADDRFAIGCILLRPLIQIKNAGEIKRLLFANRTAALGSLRPCCLRSRIMQRRKE